MSRKQNTTAESSVKSVAEAQAVTFAAVPKMNATQYVSKYGKNLNSQVAAVMKQLYKNQIHTKEEWDNIYQELISGKI